MRSCAASTTASAGSRWVLPLVARRASLPAHRLPCAAASLQLPVSSTPAAAACPLSPAAQHLAHPSAVAPAKQGPDVGWTTGILAPLEDQTNPEEPVRLQPNFT